MSLHMNIYRYTCPFYRFIWILKQFLGTKKYIFAARSANWTWNQCNFIPPPLSFSHSLNCTRLNILQANLLYFSLTGLLSNQKKTCHPITPGQARLTMENSPYGPSRSLEMVSHIRSHIRSYCIWHTFCMPGASCLLNHTFRATSHTHHHNAARPSNPHPALGLV